MTDNVSVVTLEEELEQAPSGGDSFRPYPEYRDSGFEWLGEVPVHWNETRLRHLVQCCRNGIWGEEPDGVNDVVCVRVADFDRLTFRVSLKNPTLRTVEDRQYRIHKLEQNDLLIEKSGGGDKQPVGTVMIFQHRVNAVCSNFVAQMPVAGSNIPRFVCYLFSAYYDKRVNTKWIKQTTGIQNLDASAYLAEPAIIPDANEQSKIANFLDRETREIDTLIEKKTRLINLLNEKRTAVITQAVTKGLNPKVPMKESGIEWLGEVPAHWTITRLRRVIDPGRPITYGIVQPGEPDPDGIPMVRGQDYSKGWAPLESIFRVSPAIEEPYSRSRLNAGDIVLTIVGAGVGNTEIVPEQLSGANITQTTARLSVSSKYGGCRFFRYLLLSKVGKTNTELATRGAAQPGLTLQNLGDFHILVPLLGEQDLIVKHIEKHITKIDFLIEKVRAHIEKLREYRSALIAAAVTGKIDVREAA